MNNFLLIGVIVFYFSGAFLLYRRLRNRETSDHAGKLLLVVPAVALLLHGLGLQDRIIGDDGLFLGFYEMLSLTAWNTTLLLLLASWMRPVENLGIAIFPFAAITYVLQVMLTGNNNPIVIEGIGLQVHILLSISAFSILFIAGFQALLLAVQERHLRNRHPGGLIRSLPPLETMEYLLFGMIGAGYFLLSLALVTGVPYIEDIFQQHLVHKTFLSVFAWVIFAVLLWGRWHSGWRGRKAIRWTLGGVAALIMAYFGSKLVLELMLGTPTGA